MPQSFVTMLREGRIADITALGQLFRLHKDMPDVAMQLLDSTEPVTRPMIAAASTAGATRHSSAELNPTCTAPGPSVSGGEERVDIAPKARGESVVAEHATPKSLGESRTVRASASARPLPVRIRAYFEGAIWTVEYTRQQQAANCSIAVMLESEDGRKRYAPLEDLRLQSIECV